MKELVTQTQAEMVLRAIAIGLPLIGIVIGTLIGRVRKRARTGATAGLIISLIGVVIYGLWSLYIALGNKFTFTSLGNIVVEMAAFAVIGSAAGYTLQKAIDAGRDSDSRIEKSKTTQEEKLNAG